MASSTEYAGRPRSASWPAAVVGVAIARWSSWPASPSRATPAGRVARFACITRSASKRFAARFPAVRWRARTPAGSGRPSIADAAAPIEALAGLKCGAGGFSEASALRADVLRACSGSAELCFPERFIATSVTQLPDARPPFVPDHGGYRSVCRAACQGPERNQA